MANGYKKSITLGLDISEFEQNAKKAQEDIKDVGEATEDAGASMTSASNDAESFGSGLVEVTDVASNFRSVIQASTETLVGISEALRDCVSSASDYVSTLQSISSETGWSTDEVQQLEYVASQTGTSIETIQDAYDSLQDTLEKAADGNRDARQTFYDLGVEVTDSSGNVRDANEVFYEVVDALNELDSSAEQGAEATKVFGDSANEMTQMISLGSAGIAELSGSMSGLISSDQVQALTEYNQAMAAMETSMMQVKTIIASSLAPALTAIANVISQLDPNFLAMVTVMGMVGAAALSLIAIISTIGPLFSIMATTVASAAAATSAAIAPYLAIAAAISALIVLIYKAVQAWKDYSAACDAVGITDTTDKLNNLFGVNSGSGTTGTFRNYHARGTDFAPGGLSWVGENGPELIEVPTGSRIYNTDESQSIASNTYNITMNCDLSKMKSVNDVVEAVQGLANSKRSYA